MSNIENILIKLNELIKNNELDSAEKYLDEEINKAKQLNIKDLIILLLNEKIGLMRDMGKINEATKCSLEVIKILDEENVGNTLARASAYLNVANAYRASRNHDKAFEYFDKVLKVLEICGNDELFITYYNNIAILNQDAGKFNEAIECLKKALYLVEFKLHDKLREAISRTNLASMLLRLKRIDEAEEILKPAIDIFAKDNPLDYHYSAALSAYGDIKMVRGELEEACKYFELALKEIEHHMGKNKFYEIVEDNLFSVKKMMGK